MMAGILAAALLGLQHHHDHRPLAVDAALQVTISPEARVSVQPVEPLGPLPDCDRPVEIAVAVDNQLEAPTPLIVAADPARLVGPSRFQLSGARTQRIGLKLAVRAGEAIEIRLGFDAGPGTGDLAWRSEANLLLQCAGLLGRPEPGNGPAGA